MDETTQLTVYYENATMGKDTVKHLLTVTEEKEMETLLTDQLSEYSDISEKARKALEQRKVEAQKLDR